MADQLSGGQARRLMIARALVHQPDVLFLDEPTAGLDPQTRVNLWDILQVLHDQGQTILLTTHYMEEAEALCDRIAVVDHGKVLAEGSVDKLLADSGAQTIVTVRYEEPVPDGLAERAGLAERPGVTKVEADGDQLRVFSADPEGLLGDLVSIGAANGLHVRDATPGQAQPGDRLPRPDRPRVPGVETMATTTQPASIGAASGGDAPVAASIAALITDAPVPHPTLRKTFAAMMAREFRVLGRNAPSTFIRAVMQPLLFAFVFAYVLPKIGSGFGWRRGRRVRRQLLHHPGARPDGLDVPHAGHVRHHDAAGHGVLLAAHDRGPGPGARCRSASSAIQKITAGRDPGVHRRGDRLPRRVLGARARARARTST